MTHQERMGEIEARAGLATPGPWQQIQVDHALQAIEEATA